MRPAQVSLKYLGILILMAALASPHRAWAASGNTQICDASGNCKIGEYLYDDSYAPIAGATCTVTSKYPDGTAHLTDQSMTGSADGWYQHSFTAPATTGVYRANVCCTSGTDYLCLDKTFEVKNAAPSSNDVASAVWGYSDRSLSTFGTLVADVWAYSSRSVTTFGTLVADIWANATRTLTGAGSSGLATSTNVTDAVTNIKGADNKDLTQVNAAVAGVQTDATTIKADTTTLKADTTTLKADTTTLKADTTTLKADTTTIKADTAYIRTKADQIYTDTQEIKTDVDTLITKWGVLSASDLSTSIASVSTKLGTSADTEGVASVFGRIEYLRNKWGSQTAQTVYDKANTAATKATELQTELDYNGKSSTAYEDIQELKDYVDGLETDTTTLKADATTLKADTTTLKADTTTIKADTADIRSRVTSMVADIWSYSDRSLTTFGTLIADIWANATRTLTGAGSSGLATSANVDSAVTSIKGASNKDLSQVSTEVAGVQTDATYLRGRVDLIYADTQAIQTDVDTLIAKWGVLSASDISTSVTAVSNKLGTSTDDENQATVFGRVQGIKNKWGTQTAQTIYDKANTAATTATAIQTELDYNGKSSTAYSDLQDLKTYVDTLETLIGTSSDTAATLTLFGKVKKVQDQVDKLTGIETEIDEILAKWGTLKLSDISKQVSDLRNDLSLINNVPDFKTIIQETIVNNTTIVEVKNELLSLKAVSEINRELLEKQTNAPIVKTFLIEGSVIFKTVVTNPSSLVSQTAAINYYLPQEVKRENVLKYDEELTLQYDAEKDALYVTGEVVLGRSESKTFQIEVDDAVWHISNETIASLRKQAEDLSLPLQKTSYFAQGVTLKTDIDASLDKAVEYQKQNGTPEAKIKGYKEALIEFKAAETKLDKLKELVTSAGSASNLFGFVGGAQAIAVWGLIIIMVAGFVFLVVYMRTLRVGEVPKVTKASKVPEVSEEREEHRPKKGSGALRYISMILVVGLTSSAISGGIVYMFAASKNTVPVAQVKEVSSTDVLGVQQVTEEVKEATPSSNVQEGVSQGNSEAQKYQLTAKGQETVSLTEKPVSTSTVISTHPVGTGVEIIGGSESWKKVKVDGVAGWVKGENVRKSKVSRESKGSLGEIIVTDTPTGFLNVRKAPGGTEITQAYPGDEFALVRDLPEWWQVELEDGSYGWVSKKYAVADR